MLTNRLSQSLTPTLYFHTSTDDGANFGPPVAAVSGPSGSYFFGPFTIAVDRSSILDNVYAGYSQASFDGTSASYSVIKSTDGGVTWSSPSVVTGTPLRSPSLSVDRITGDVFVFGADDKGAFHSFRSTDRGATFHEYSPSFANILPLNVNRVSIAHSVPDSSGHRIFVVGVQGCSSSITMCTSTDVYAGVSDDGGSTFSGFMKVNANPTAQSDAFLKVGTVDSSHFFLAWYESVDPSHATKDVAVSECDQNLSCTQPIDATGTFPSSIATDPTTPYSGIANIGALSDSSKIYLTYVTPDPKNGNLAGVFFTTVSLTPPCTTPPTITSPDALPPGTVDQGYPTSPVPIVVSPPGSYSLSLSGDFGGNSLLLGLSNNGVNEEIVSEPLTQPGTFRVNVTARLNPNPNNCPDGTRTYTLVVDKAGTTVSALEQAGAILFGQQDSIAITVGGTAGVTPTGTVEVLNGTTIVGTATLSGGRARIPVSPPVGSHTLTAAYLGNPDFLAATSAPFTIQVSPADVSTSFSATATGWTFSRVNNSSSTTWTFRNMSDASVGGPVFAEFPGLAISNADGIGPSGNSYKALSSPDIQPGQSVSIKIVIPGTPKSLTAFKVFSGGAP